MIFVVSGLLAASSSLQRPSREALMPRTVRHDADHRRQRPDQPRHADRRAGRARRSAACWWPTSGIGWCFLVDICGLARRDPALRRDAPLPAPGGDDAAQPGRHRRGAALRVLGRRDLLGTYLVDIAAMLLALPVVLFPALAEEVFGRPELLGLLYSAETVGALLATALSGWTSRVHHHGRAIVVAAAAYGACVGLAGLMPSIWLVAVLPDAVGRRRHGLGGLPRHGLEPDDPRGTCAAGWPASRCCPTPSARSAARSAPASTADLWTVRGAIASGGFACVAGVGVTALALRDFWSYDARTDEHAVAERDRPAARRRGAGRRRGVTRRAGAEPHG